jgi:putative oxidoreductase
MRRLLFGRPSPASGSMDLGLLILRAVSGLALALAHGIGKVPPSERFVATVTRMGFPAPEAMAWLAGLAELGGGLLLAVGLLTRPTALVVAIHFVLVVVVASAGDTFLERERAVLFLMAAVTLLFTGPGRYSVDAMIERRRPEI